MDYILSTDGLTKVYGRHRAVSNVSLHIKRGEIYGFIGRNGAGKTTFMKMISGLAAPTEGDIMLFGKRGAQANAYHSRIGNLIESPGLYPNMTGYENLHCKGLALGIRKKGFEKELMELVGLADAGKKKTKQYSLGMRQRLGIAMALVANPDFLILDEPINGLDPQGIAQMREMLLRLRTDYHMTIMISSHILEELSKIADTFGIIHEGQLIQELSREELTRQCTDYMELHVSDTALASTVLEQEQITQYKVISSDCIHIFEGLEHSGALNMALTQAGCTVTQMRVEQKNLEQYFLDLTGGGKYA